MTHRPFPIIGLVIVCAASVGCSADRATEVTASQASASSVHLKGGAHATPDFTDQGLTLEADGSLSGLGNGDVLITIDATADPTATCTNPSNDGEHQPPGQNPAEVEVTGSTSIPASEVKNGNTPFTVVTEPPETPIDGAPDCPNSQWTEDIVDLAFKTATITVEQPEENVVLVVSCTFDPPTSDGAVSGVSCTQSH